MRCGTAMGLRQGRLIRKDHEPGVQRDVRHKQTGNPSVAFALYATQHGADRGKGVQRPTTSANRMTGAQLYGDRPLEQYHNGDAQGAGDERQLEALPDAGHRIFFEGKVGIVGRMRRSMGGASPSAQKVDRSSSFPVEPKSCGLVAYLSTHPRFRRRRKTHTLYESEQTHKKSRRQMDTETVKEEQAAALRKQPGIVVGNLRTRTEST